MDGTEQSLLIGAAAASWFGILTSISPCPLATNVAAISFIGKQFSNTRQVLLSGLVYTLGRAATYMVLGMLIVGGIQKASEVSQFLHNYMNKLLGPLLIVIGMFLLGLIQLNWSWSMASETVQGRVEKAGILGAGFLGILFALSFCPLSAVLFFGSLTGLAVKHSSPVLLPLLYGVGTALPVVVFAVLIAVGARSFATAYNRLTQFELWARWVTGVILILVGVYYCLLYIFGVFSIRGS